MLAIDHGRWQAMDRSPSPPQDVPLADSSIGWAEEGEAGLRQVLQGEGQLPQQEKGPDGLAGPLSLPAWQPLAELNTSQRGP